MKISFNAVARPIYSKIVSASQAKYTDGKGRKPMDAPNPVKGMIVNTVMPVNVSNVRGSEARLWINGIFGVRIMWITSV